MSASPTQRTLAYCRKHGWPAGVVEKWIQQTMQRKDLFGFIDLIVLDDFDGCLGVQATSTGNMNSRIYKALEIPELKVWLQHGNRFEVWGWAKQGKVGKRKLWTLKVKRITFDGDAYETNIAPA